MKRDQTIFGLQSQTPVKAKPYLLKLTQSLAIALFGLIPDTMCDSLRKFRWGFLFLFLLFLLLCENKVNSKFGP